MPERGDDVDAVATVPPLVDAWLAGWRAHKYGELCEHGYGPGDHHWEQGACLADTFEVSS